LVCWKCFHRISEDMTKCTRCGAVQKEPAVLSGAKSLIRMIRPTQPPRGHEPEISPSPKNTHDAHSHMIFCWGCGDRIHQSTCSCPQCGAPQHRSFRIPGKPNISLFRYPASQSTSAHRSRRTILVFVISIPAALWAFGDAGIFKRGPPDSWIELGKDCIGNSPGYNVNETYRAMYKAESGSYLKHDGAMVYYVRVPKTKERGAAFCTYYQSERDNLWHRTWPWGLPLVTND
jgi:hypothetical protein